MSKERVTRETPLQVVAGVLCKSRASTTEDYRFLVGTRRGHPWPNRWEFPGGKIEQGETAEQAIIREWKEELNIDIVPGFIYDKKLFRSSMGEAEITFFSVYLQNSWTLNDLELRDHHATMWLTKKQILGMHPKFCTPSLVYIAEFLQGLDYKE